VTPSQVTEGKNVSRGEPKIKGDQGKGVPKEDKRNQKGVKTPLFNQEGGNQRNCSQEGEEKEEPPRRDRAKK